MDQPARVQPPGTSFNFAHHLFERNAQRPHDLACVGDQGRLSHGKLAALATSADESGHEVKTLVVLEEGVEASGAQLQAFVKDCLAACKCPRLIEFLPQLPKTAVDKILSFNLREREAAAR